MRSLFAVSTKARRTFLCKSVSCSSIHSIDAIEQRGHYYPDLRDSALAVMAETLTDSKNLLRHSYYQAGSGKWKPAVCLRRLVEELGYLRCCLQHIQGRCLPEHCIQRWSQQRPKNSLQRKLHPAQQLFGGKCPAKGQVEE